jgi:hypothetical protein
MQCRIGWTTAVPYRAALEEPRFLLRRSPKARRPGRANQEDEYQTQSTRSGDLLAHGPHASSIRRANGTHRTRNSTSHRRTREGREPRGRFEETGDG